LSYGEGITFFPLTEVIQQACGIKESDAPAAAGDKLRSLVADAPDGDRIAPLVAGLMGWSQPGGIEDAFWAVRKLFEHLAREAELVVVFDDIHWGEQTFLDLVDHLADWTRDAAVLLLCVARPELLDVRPVWAGGKLNATSILLEPLTSADASRLLDTLLANPEIPSEVRRRILQAADGNPLFVEEMAAMLLERDAVKSETGLARAGDLMAVSVPPTIQLLLAARLDALAAEERAVIERGAVEGNVFHTGAVATLTPEQLRSEVSSRLLALTRKELIRPDRPEFAGQDAFRFRHLLIRDAAYQALPKEVRGELHERFARWLERAAGDRIVEYEEIVAHHLEQAYRSRIDLGPPGPETDSLRSAAAERLLRSAERANNRGDFSSGRALIEKAVELSDRSLRSRALLELALTHSALFDFRNSTAVATEAMAAAEESGERAQWLRARLIFVADMGQLDPAYTVQWSLSESRAVLRELESLGDEAGILEAKLTVATHLFYLGDGNACRDIVLALPSQARGLPFKQRRTIVINLVIPSYFGPARPEEALVVAEDAHRLLSPSLISEANLAVMRTALFAMMGRAEEFRAEGRRAEQLWDEVAQPSLRLTTYQFLGEAERFLGRPDLAEQQFRKGVEGLSASGETGWNSTMIAVLALSLCDQDRFDEAGGLVHRSRDLGAEDDFATQMAWRMGMARIDSHRGEHERAISLADEAVALGEDTDYIAWQAEGHDVRGRALLAAGRAADARGAFATSLERYERKGVVPAVERLRARLATL
jgi:tetratricopeptide (TPR) repeat protein